MAHKDRWPSNRIRVVVAAPACECSEVPVALNELGERNMVGVAVAHVSALREWGDDDQGNPCSVAKEIERLNVSGVPVAAAFVESYEDCGALPGFRTGLNGINDFLCEPFEDV